MRVKGGVKGRRRHKRLLKETRGYFGARSKLFRRAHEAFLHAGSYAFVGRKDRKGAFRRLWIQRINAALQPYGFKYSDFIRKLKDKKIGLDRKILSQLALDHPQVFKQLAESVK